MKWYKHDSKSHTDEKIRDLVLRFGQEGYGIYVTCLELIAEKIDSDQNPKILISDRVLREICRVSHQKLTKILSFFDQNSLIFSNFHSEYWNLNCPNLLKRLDNWTRDCQVASKKPSTQQEQEVKKENKNKNSLTVREPKKPESLEVVKVYFQELGVVEEAHAFYDHFQSNGWRVGGKAPMKDWRAACRNWLRSPYRKNKTQERRTKLMRELQEINYEDRNVSKRDGVAIGSVPAKRNESKAVL